MFQLSIRLHVETAATRQDIEMFRLATCMITGRQVLLVEDDDETSGSISAAVRKDGGIVVGISVTVEHALSSALELGAELVLLHVRYVAGYPVPIAELFSPLGIEVGFLACNDDWFEFDQDGNDESARSAVFA